LRYCFSIDALSPSAAAAWRLQDDQRWRQVVYAEPLQAGDARLIDQQAIAAWLGVRLKKDRTQGLVRQQRAGRFDFLMRGIFAHAVVHRFSAAPLPDLAQMVACHAGCEPGRPWLVYLDLAGHFCALDSDQQSILQNLSIAVRGEIASSPAYIGAQAAADAQLMGTIYHQFLAGWLEHLRSSNMQIFVPEVKQLKPQEELIAAIQAWQPEAEG